MKEYIRCLHAVEILHSSDVAQGYLWVDLASIAEFDQSCLVLGANNHRRIEPRFHRQR